MPENAGLQELYDRLKNSNSGSLLKKHLTQTTYGKLKDKITNYGGTLADCIRSGNVNKCLRSFFLFFFFLFFI